MKKATKRKTSEATRFMFVFIVVIAMALALSPLLYHTPFALGGAAETEASQQTADGEVVSGGMSSKEASLPTEGHGTGTSAEDPGTAAPDAGGTAATASREQATALSPTAQGTIAQGEGAPAARGMQLQSVQDGDDTLTLAIGNNGSFQDVRQYSWAYTNELDTRQIRVSGTFSDWSTDKERTIEILIPRGYVIKEYSANSTASNPDSSKLGLIRMGATAEGVTSATVLTAADGSSWAQQKIAGYGGDYRSYEGKLVYSFKPNCQNIQLIVTLALDQAIMDHDDDASTLQNIQATLKSGSKTLRDTVQTTVTGLNTAKLSDWWESKTLTSESSPTFDATTPIFSDPFMTSRSYFLDTASFTMGYPAGFTFLGLDGDRASFVGNTGTRTVSYDGGRTMVTHDAQARTVTFSFDKIGLAASMKRVCNWAVNMDQAVGGSWDRKTGELFSFPIASNLSSGTLIGNPMAHGTLDNIGHYSVYVSSSGQVPGLYEIGVAPLNRPRHDFNASGDYPYDYYLGGMNYGNTMTTAVNMNLTWTFDDSLGVRALLLGLDSFKNIKVTVKRADGSTYVNTYAGPTNKLTAAMLGMANDEHITQVNTSINHAGGLMSCYYFGRWQGGQEGNATLDIKSANGNAFGTSHTPIGWNRAQFGDVTTKTARGGTYYPSESILFTTNITAGDGMYLDSNEVVDPIIYISLPKGINLDLSSIQALSPNGNHQGAAFTLKLAGVEQKDLKGDGVMWNVYKLTSENRNDMIAHAEMIGLPGASSEPIKVTFKANISSGCNYYPAIKIEDVVRWDIGAPAYAVSGSNSISDNMNVAGKGTGYRVAADVAQADIAVVPEPGLMVQLGARVAGSGGAFRDYDGTEGSIVGVSASQAVEVQLSYSNTAGTDLKAGTEIYLPIPKMGIEYDRYFYNLRDNPYVQANESTATPRFSMALTAPIDATAAGFTALYSIADIGMTNPMSTSNAWVPLPDSFMSYGDLVSAGYGLADVTMVKFVANQTLVAGSDGSFALQMTANDGVLSNQVNYWRAYQKGWEADNGMGTWFYSTAVAARAQTAGYVVEHWLEQPDGSYVHQTGDDQYLTGVVGQGVTATPKTYATHSFNPSHPGNILVGTVDMYGSLILREYYDLPKYQVVYVAPQATSGVVPVDAGRYAVGASATLLGGNTLARDGYTFSGWTTAPANGTVRYGAGDIMTPGAFGQATFGPASATSPNYTITLYANWTANVPDPPLPPDPPVPPTPPVIPTPPGQVIVNFVPTTVDRILGFISGAPTIALQAGGSDIAIADDGTPLAVGHWCWIHPWIVLGIIITLAYSVVVVIRRRRFSRWLDDMENNTFDNSPPQGSAAEYGTQGLDQPIRQP